MNDDKRCVHFYLDVQFKGQKIGIHCSTVVLGGEVAELLGDALLDALNARLEELCLSPVRVRRPASADDGLIGMAAHITRMEVDALLEEE